MGSVEEALRAREERKKKEEQEAIESYQAKKAKVDSAVEAYKNRKKNSAQGAVSDLATRINSEIDIAKKGYSPSWGTGSLKNTLDSTRESSINIDNLTREVESYKNYFDEDTYNALNTSLQQLREAYDSTLGLAELREQFDSEDAYKEWYATYKKHEETENEALNDVNFGGISQLGASVSNPSWKDSKDPINLFGWKPLGEGETINNMVTFAEANKDAIMIEYAQAMRGGGGVSKQTEFLYLINEHMTDEEKRTYNYFIGKGEVDKANEYLESLEATFTQRQAGTIADTAMSDKFSTMLFGLVAGLDQFASGVGNLDNLIMGTEADPITAVQYANSTVRENLDGAWGVAYDLANTTGNMLPSILVGSFTGGLGGAATLGTSAIGNGYAEMRNLGYDEWQSRGYGLLVGASETALQYALGGISKLGGKLSGNVISKVVGTLDNALAKTAIKLGGNMASEGLEEAIQTIIEPAFKSLMTGEEFEPAKWEDVWYSALLGALSAGVLEGAPTIAGTTASSIKAQKVYGADAQALVTESLDIDPNNAHAQRMQARLDNGKNVSGYQLNRLVEANETALVSQDKAKMKSAVEARLTELGETGDISKLADVIVKAQSEGNLTHAERSLLVNSKYGRRVSTELNPKSIESGAYTSKWAENLGTERINTEAYNKGLYDLATEKAGVAVDEKKVSVTKNPTAKENATEAKFEVSTDGKTRIGDMEVSIKEIASVKDGKVTLRLEDGSTVDASDVEYGSTAEGLLYENVVEMNLNAATANAFIKGYDPSMSVQEYVLGFREAYRYGEYGFPTQEMSADGFSAKLSESQKSLAYNLGKTDSKYKVETKQAKIASTSAIKAGKDSQKTSKKGKLHNTIKPTTERQKASLKALGVVANTLGIDIYTFESAVVNGKRQGANGWFNPKDGSIHIDIHAGINGEGTMLFTAAHELTHFIREWSPAKFKVFADFLLEQYGKKGVSVDALVREQIAKAKRNGRDISYDTAYEEVIADSCEAMLADGDAVAKIAELKAKDKTLWQKIKEYLTNLVARIKSAYEGMSPDSVEGNHVAEMLDTAERLKALWTEALVEASDNYTSAEKTLVENGITVDSKTESASLMSVRDLLDSKQQQKVAESLATRFGVTVEEAKGWISAETSLASLILNPKYSQYLDYTADPSEVAIKSNSDYPQGTVDFSNICKKRRDFTEVMNRVLRNFPNHVFEATDLAKIRTIMMEENMEVACGICYVEDRRQLDSIVAQNFIDSLALYRSGSKTRPDGNAFNTNQLKALKLVDGDNYTPSIYELISLEGRNALKAKNPAMEEAWVKFNNARGMQSVRLLLNDAEYKRQILKYSPTTVKSKNNLGGLRIYSFSDMEMFHLIDIIQVITDSATVGLSLQGYTKVNEYAKAVKDTGEKLNRSLIPKGTLGYHIENGKVVLDFDAVEGIDINHKDFFDNIDNPNVGNIVIGINREQIRAAMTSKFIDQIIPFHTGQSNEVLGEKGIASWVNYKDSQSEADIATGKKSSHQINIYTEVIEAAEKEGKPITNKVDFVNKFLQVCKENNLQPRFSEFLNVDVNGDYVYTEGYHKFLVDFKTFDQNTGEYLPQMPVKPIFDDTYLMGLLKDYVKSQKVKDAKVAEAMPKVLDRITKEIVGADVKLSDRESYAPTFYSHMGKVVDGIKSEKVGANGVVPYLKGKGVKNEEIKWSGIEAFLEGKKSVTKAELQEFVAGSQLQIVEQVSGEDIDLRYDGSKRAYNLYDADGKVIDTFTYNEFLGAYVAESDEEMYSNDIELTEALRDAYGKTSAPKWEDYRIDGGSNYRELVFQLSNSSYSNRAMRVHWGQDAEGVLAHARIQDMTTADGKKMLFIEEIQSDWHNEGHQKGYSTKEYEDAVESHDKLYNEYKKLDLAFHKYVRSNEFMTDPDDVRKKKHDWLRGKVDTAQKKYLDAEKVVTSLKEKGAGDTPDAPFRDAYHEYVLKRLLRMAAEEGYDSIGWTPAEIQSKRWSDEYAEGYRIEYDQDIPSFLKKYGKKWGAKVGNSYVNPVKDSNDLVAEIEKDIDGYKQQIKEIGEDASENEYVEFLTDGIADMQATIERLRGTKVWSMSIPDSMKESVLHEGQVLYSDRNFASQVDAVLNGADTNSTHLKLMDTPSLLQEAGLPNLPILMTAKHLKKITAEKGHGLDVEVVKKLPEYISSPVMIADSFTRDDSVVIITEAIDSENRPVVAAILLNGSGRLDGNHIDANIMTSAYGRNNFQSFLDRIAESDSVIYFDKEKSQDLSVSLGVQFPHAITSLDSGVIIHQAKAFVNTQNEKTLHSDRNPDSVSNRSLLANALETVAQNDIERSKLKQYKAKIDLINSEQAKLQELREQIKELSFAKGPRDAKAIKDLQFEASQAANRITTYDKQLLNLESTKALKDVLEREKQMAYKRAEQRGKDALAAYRERATKTQRELMTRYQESRKKGVESRHKTAMRHKIKDVVNELNQYLLKGTKDKHVPIELQKAVAEALDAVNMDTIGAEERLAKIHEQLEKDPFNHHLLESYKRIAEQGERMDGKLQSLKNAYNDIVNSDDPLIANSHDEVISNAIEKVIKDVGSTPLRDMTLEQLESVYDLYKMVLTSVRNANKAFTAKKKEEISVIANRVMEEIDKVGKKKLYRTKASQELSKFDWNNLKPVYAFERIGSASFTEVFNNVRAGEDTWAVDITEAKEFSAEQRKKFKYDSWDFKKRFTFTSSSGMNFELSLDQIMSLYAYSKREQAKDHLKKGGIVFDETTEVTIKTKIGIPVKFNPTQATAYNLSDDTLVDIIGKLTEEQRAFVDTMQDYLSTTMGDKGNEVSLALYGVKLYKEKNYFPLKSASQFMAKAKEQQKGEVKIKNSGFSKETTPKASNPIVLTPFMDVWADHVNEMSMYHAFVLPLEDFYRVFNYKTPTSDTMATESVEMFLQNAYGKGATQYIDQLLKDLNGGARVDPTAGIINKLTGRFKKSAVFASVSVVVQQPSAIARATALVDTKYFVGKPSGKHKDTWAEVKKYAPVAVIKEMGYFDTGMGQSTVEWIKDDKTWKDKIDDVASKAPALADEYAWCAIWNAVKRETLNTHKDLKPNSDEFLKAVGERFTEVITKTQVYDSVLARSANMRSKDTGMKMVTAFMGEPTTSINMLENALIQGKRGDVRYARKAVGSVVASMVLNSILVSFVYAGRDDDDEKTYSEKYISTLIEELLDSVNPLTLIPFAKDIVSIWQGYDVERSDMAVITDLINAWKNLSNDNRSAYRKVEDFAGAIASIFGLPLKNVMRDVRGMYNTVDSFINGEKTTGAGMKNAIEEAITGDAKSNGQQLYEAMVDGDTEQIERVKGRFKDQNAINSAVRTALRENDPRIKEAAQARYNGDIAEYMRIAKAIIAEGHFKQDDVVAAINSEINLLKKGEGTTESSESKVKSMYEVSDYYAALVGRDEATAYVVKEDIIKTGVANGKDRDEAEEAFTSSFVSYLRDEYESGELSNYDARNMLVKYGGKTEEEALSKVRYWEFKKEYPDYDLSESAVTAYYEEVEPSGIKVGVYYDYYKRRADCKGSDNNGDGRTDSGSVKAQVMNVIDSLPISNAQKDTLYYLNGWSASTLYEAPWH